MQLQIVIPTKDRAAQLELLLRTMREMFAEWREQRITIVYRATSSEYERGYEKAKEIHPEFTYAKETRFVDDLRANMGEETYFQFFMDDDVFVAPFSLSSDEFKLFASDKNIAALVIRMAPYMDYCYAENVRTPPPFFRKDGAWWWIGLRGDWGYPNSVDGSIWRTDDVKECFSNSQYKCLHELEPALKMYMRGPLALCFRQPRIVNVANNSVQDSAPINRNAGADPQEYNRRFLAGERIKPDNIRAAKPKSPHFEIEYEWE